MGASVRGGPGAAAAGAAARRSARGGVRAGSVSWPWGGVVVARSERAGGGVSGRGWRVCQPAAQCSSSGRRAALCRRGGVADCIFVTGVPRGGAPFGSSTLVGPALPGATSEQGRQPRQCKRRPRVACLRASVAISLPRADPPRVCSAQHGGHATRNQPRMSACTRQGPSGVGAVPPRGCRAPRPLSEVAPACARGWLVPTVATETLLLPSCRAHNG